jgi:parallel beta-helix repeat protein
MRRAILLLCLLLPLPAWAQMTYYTRQAESRHFGRHLPRGSDSVTCEQARQAATPKASINGGIACLAAGDTLEIGPGHYDELLQGQMSDSRTCPSADQTIQPGCAVIPNGASAERPTVLRGTASAVVVSPRGRRLSGGGGILTYYDYSRYQHIEGLRFVADSTPGSASGVHLGNTYGVLFTRNEIAYGTLNSSHHSQYHAILGNDVHHAGEGCDRRTQGSPPCPHGMYVCGQHHVIASNDVHHNSNYGIQISCEQGGISDVRVERNRVAYNKGVGIRIQGSNNTAVANQLVSNGVGITTGGSGLIAHNTFDGFDADMDDPFGLWYEGNFQIVNNLFTRMKSAWLIVRRRSGSTYVDPDPQVVHHNGCDLQGNVGCTLVHPTDAWYQDLASGDYHLATQSPAKGAGASDTGVTVDIQYATYQQPDLGAYAWQGTPPIPPEPPATGLVLACVGQVSAVPGQIQMTCTQQQEERR